MNDSQLNKPAPDFCLPDENGTEVCLKQYRGKWIVLYFYPKDNTSGCTIEAIDFSKEKTNFEKMGAHIIGVSPDSGKSHCTFREKHDLSIQLLSDTEKKVLEACGAWGEKQMYGKTYFGVIRSTFLIDPEGLLAYEWRDVKVKGHIAEVKQKLSEIIK